MNAALDRLRHDVVPLLGRPLSTRELELFGKYLDILMKWQRSQRLLGSGSPMWIVENAFLDSVAFVPLLGEGDARLVDIGSGAGVPGIPIKIVRPAIAVSLLESRRRKASFLRAARRTLGLSDLEVIEARLEDVPATTGFDVAVMRCAGKWEEVLPFALRVVRRGGRVIAAGPPPAHAGALAQGRWAAIPVRAGITRRFAVYAKS